MGRLGNSRLSRTRLSFPDLAVDSAGKLAVTTRSISSVEKIATKAGKSPLTVTAKSEETLAIAQDPASIAFGSFTARQSSDESYDIILSGTAVVSGSTIEGAEISVVNEDTDTVVQTTTSGSNGEWSFTVPGGPEYHIIAEFEAGDGTQYNVKSKPFIDSTQVN